MQNGTRLAMFIKPAVLIRPICIFSLVSNSVCVLLNYLFINPSLTNFDLTIICISLTDLWKNFQELCSAVR